MKNHIHLLPSCLAAALPLFLFCSCVENKKSESPKAAAALETPQQHRTVVEPSLLPNRFQQTGYMIREESTDSSSGGGNAAGLDGLQLKVGANISTNEPIPLREAMKAIAKTKNMSLSWAPDVNQDLLVDIDIRANDNFYEAIDHILRQLDYFHEVEASSTLVIKYRETKQYQIAMPFIKQEYTSTTGVKSLDSTAQLGSSGNTFDIWENVQKNIDSLIATWATTATTPEGIQTATKQENEKKGTADKKSSEGEGNGMSAPLSRQVSSTNSSYTIDKPVGLITVHAPRSLQKKITDYLAALEKELYKQITIEAKIIEVQLDDSSSLGINWHVLLDNLRFASNSSLQRSKEYGRDISDGNSIESSKDYSDRNSTTKERTKKSGSTSATDSSGNYEIKGTGEKQVSSVSSDSSATEDGDTTTSNKYEELSDNSLKSESSSELLNSGSSGSSSSDESSSESISRSIGSTALDIGSAAATIITSGTNISESLSVGTSLLANFSFPAFVKALQAQGQTSILSNPKISVMNGQPALISVGKNVTYISKVDAKVDKEGGVNYSITTDKVLSGVGLALSAVVKKDNEIIMNLVPLTSELTEPIEYRSFGLGSVGLPIVNMREMSTTVKIKDGSMLVVGGLISDKEIKEGENFVPGTKDIPYLKYLFGYEVKKKIKRELIILLRPRII